MKEVCIKVLNKEHGKEVEKFFEAIGCNCNGWSFNATELNEGEDGICYYGNLGDTKKVKLFRKSQTYRVMTLEQAKKLFPEIFGKSNKTIQNQDMKVVKTTSVKIGEVDREVTIVVAVCNGNVRTGYSVRMPNDKPIEGLGEKIALGRAMNDRTNLTSDMVMGIGMDKKYILYAIAENWLKVISKGGIVKGIK